MWDVLTDFSAYPEWNPYMEIEGTLQVGTKVTVRMGAGGGRGMVFKPAVLAASAGEELRWPARLSDGVYGRDTAMCRSPGQTHEPPTRPRG